MFASLVIITLSVMLFLYWFRYTCLLILSAKTSRDYTAEVATANQLEFPQVQAYLDGQPAAAKLDQLHQLLDRDYRLLTGVLRHAAEFQLGGFSVEQRMLMIDYKIMKLAYSISIKLSKANEAREALEEMTDIVAHFANAMGERAAAGNRA